jgi:hypothetical protein
MMVSDLFNSEMTMTFLKFPVIGLNVTLIMYMYRASYYRYYRIIICGRIAAVGVIARLSILLLQSPFQDFDLFAHIALVKLTRLFPDGPLFDVKFSQHKNALIPEIWNWSHCGTGNQQ